MFTIKKIIIKQSYVDIFASNPVNHRIERMSTHFPWLYRSSFDRRVSSMAKNKIGNGRHRSWLILRRWRFSTSSTRPRFTTEKNHPMIANNCTGTWPTILRRPTAARARPRSRRRPRSNWIGWLSLDWAVSLLIREELMGFGREVKVRALAVRH